MFSIPLNFANLGLWLYCLLSLNGSILVTVPICIISFNQYLVPIQSFVWIASEKIFETVSFLQTVIDVNMLLCLCIILQYFELTFRKFYIKIHLQLVLKIGQCGNPDLLPFPHVNIGRGCVVASSFVLVTVSFLVLKFLPSPLVSLITGILVITQAGNAGVLGSGSFLVFLVPLICVPEFVTPALSVVADNISDFRVILGIAYLTYFSHIIRWSLMHVLTAWI